MSQLDCWLYAAGVITLVRPLSLADFYSFLSKERKLGLTSYCLIMKWHGWYGILIKFLSGYIILHVNSYIRVSTINRCAYNKLIHKIIHYL